MNRLCSWGRNNWFILVAPLLAAAAWLMARSVAWTEEAYGFEAALLFDVLVTIPLLYAICYGAKVPRRQLALRMVGLACLGIYLLSYVVPAEAAVLLPTVAPLRWLGLAVLIGLEVWLLMKAIQLVFGAGATAEELQAKTGAPPLIAKLMVMEARFWKAVWRLLRRR